MQEKAAVFWQNKPAPTVAVREPGILSFFCAERGDHAAGCSAAGWGSAVTVMVRLMLLQA